MCEATHAIRRTQKGGKTYESKKFTPNLRDTRDGCLFNKQSESEFSIF